MEESPLHPFELHDCIPLILGGIDISINKAVIMMWVVVGLISILMIMAGVRPATWSPGSCRSLAEMIVDFIRGIILDTMGKDGHEIFPVDRHAVSLYFLLQSHRLDSRVVHGHQSNRGDGGVCCTVYGLSLVLGFLLHGGKFLGILVPPGTPGWLLPLMIPIELISQLARPISLAVRLFANMTAGHVIFGVLFGLAISGGLSSDGCRLPLRLR